MREIAKKANQELAEDQDRKPEINDDLVLQQTIDLKEEKEENPLDWIEVD